MTNNFPYYLRDPYVEGTFRLNNESNTSVHITAEHQITMADERITPVKLTDLLVTLMTTPEEMAFHFPWLSRLGYGTNVPSFVSWRECNSYVDYKLGHSIYYKVSPALTDFQKFPFSEEQVHSKKAAHLQRAWNIYRVITREMGDIDIGSHLLFENKTGNQVLELLSTFPSLGAGLDVFWHIPHGMNYIMFVLRHLLGSLIYLFDRIEKNKNYHFDIPLQKYRYYLNGFSYFGYRPSLDYDTDEGDPEMEPPFDTEEYYEWEADKEAKWREVAKFNAKHGPASGSNSQ